MKELSILIPARNEMFLAKTIEDILSKIEADTEIITVLDGAWSDPGIPQHERVIVVRVPESIGQRAATNLACRLSKAKYVMKCDAHCSFDQGFDRKMISEMQDDWTMVPKMYNLHAFDWVCACGNRKYQGPTPEHCEKCGKEMQREILWKAKKSPETTAMRFDRSLKFQYWGEFKKRQKGDIVETMSILGACFMLTRQKYWELEICDEAHGSWGQQGTEVACKTWLSGGRLVVNKKTWFAHMFRTQGGDFSHPYDITAAEVEKARDYSKALWLGNNWTKAKFSLDWLLKKFAPIPDWDVKKGIVYYTDNRLDSQIMSECQKMITNSGLPIVSVSLKPLKKFGKNICLNLERGYLTMAKQILAGLEASDADIIFFCEHDVLYHPTHFNFLPERNDRYYYNVNVWKIRSDGHALKVNDCRQLSGLCAYRELLIKHFRERVRRIEAEGFSRKMGFEPGTHNRKERVDDFKSEIWESEFPNLDIRHGNTLTPSRWEKNKFRDQKYTRGWTEKNIDNIDGWETSSIKKILNNK